MKRLFDIICALTGLVILSPVFLVVALFIKTEDGGPVFYRGIRVGKGGRSFRIFKFRSMIVNAESRGGLAAPADDPRITRIGKALRKTKIDELPQLINVLNGEMSLVGPRPEVQKFVDLFTEEERKILTVLPGITDWASIWNHDQGEILSGSADAEQVYLERVRPEKIRLQMKYVNEHSFLTDLAIIFATLKTLFVDRLLPKPLRSNKQ